MDFDREKYELHLEAARAVRGLDLSFKSIVFDPKLHPRGLDGRWRDVVGAASRWFEMDHAVAVKGASRGQTPKLSFLDGSAISSQKTKQIEQDASVLVAASKGRSSHKELYRGAVAIGSKDEVEKRFSFGSVVEWDGLTAASPDKRVAERYGDTENTGGEGISVLYQLYDKNAIQGFDRDELETLLPPGQQWKVRSKRWSDGMLVVSLSPVR